MPKAIEFRIVFVFHRHHHGFPIQNAFPIKIFILAMALYRKIQMPFATH